MDVLTLNLTLDCHVSLPNITGFDFQINHMSHTSRCRHCKSCHYHTVDFIAFHNVTCYTNSLLTRIHVNTTKPLNITYTLVATSVILWSSEWYSMHTYSSRDHLWRYSCMAQRKPHHATWQIGYPYNTADHSNSLGPFDPHVIRQTQDDKLHSPKTRLSDHLTPQCEYKFNLCYFIRILLLYMVFLILRTLSPPFFA